MKRLLLVTAITLAALVAACAIAVQFGLRLPGMDVRAGLTGQQQMNADNAIKILDSADLSTFALPVTEPSGLEYLTTVRTAPDGFELAFQHHGTFFTLCDGDSYPNSACDEPSAEVIRQEEVEGRTVRIARIDMAKAGDGDKVVELDPTTADEQQSIDFWRTAELVRGDAPDWVSALAQGL